MADATFVEVLGGRVAVPACVCGHERGAHQVVAKGNEERPSFRLAMCLEFSCRCDRYIPEQGGD